MRKLIRASAAILISLVILAILAALFINIRGIPTYDPQGGDLKVMITPERVARGEKLSNVLCANCHADPQTGLLTGKHMMEAGTQFGEINSQNITADKQFGIGRWTDWEIYYLLRTGIKRDGSYAPPYMAKLPHMADEDVYSIIAYLRSNMPAVAAQKVQDKPCEPSFLTKFLCFVAFKPLPLPEGKILIPDTNNLLEFGKYMTINLDCWTCHSEDFKTMNVAFPEKTPGYCGGGNTLYDAEGNALLSMNLTSDASGIGGWSLDQFTNAVRYGKVEGQDALRYPMLPYTRLTDTEVKAIYTYLRSVPKINNKVERSVF